jgi:hypothetical protein
MKSWVAAELRRAWCAKGARFILRFWAKELHRGMRSATRLTPTS